QDSVYLQVIADFQKAVDLLPFTYANVTGPDQGQVGRATKGSAMAFMGKVLLFRKQYADAATQFLNVINTKLYSLVPDYRDNFTDLDENNSESIFEVQF